MPPGRHTRLTADRYSYDRSSTAPDRSKHRSDESTDASDQSSDAPEGCVACKPLSRKAESTFGQTRLTTRQSRPTSHQARLISRQARLTSRSTALTARTTASDESTRALEDSSDAHDRSKHAPNHDMLRVPPPGVMTSSEPACAPSRPLTGVDCRARCWSAMHVISVAPPFGGVDPPSRGAAADLIPSRSTLVRMARAPLYKRLLYA
jgi:hypothetical protein